MTNSFATEAKIPSLVAADWDTSFHSLRDSGLSLPLPEYSLPSHLVRVPFRWTEQTQHLRLFRYTGKPFPIQLPLVCTQGLVPLPFVSRSSYTAGLTRTRGLFVPCLSQHWGTKQCTILAQPLCGVRGLALLSKT